MGSREKRPAWLALEKVFECLRFLSVYLAKFRILTDTGILQKRCHSSQLSKAQPLLRLETLLAASQAVVILLQLRLFGTFKQFFVITLTKRTQVRESVEDVVDVLLFCEPIVTKATKSDDVACCRTPKADISADLCRLGFGTITASKEEMYHQLDRRVYFHVGLIEGAPTLGPDVESLHERIETRRRLQRSEFINALLEARQFFARELFGEVFRGAFDVGMERLTNSTQTSCI